MSTLACTICEQPLALSDRICPRCRNLALLCERYLVRPRRIGEGGFATVYEATDITLGRRCAVKVIEYKPGDLARVEREVRALVHLNELKLSFVPTIHDIDDKMPGCYSIIMEYVTGPTLDQLVTQPWAPERVERFLSTMLGHLNRLHEAGVIHRDIKPANIKQPRDDEYVLLDFGIAKHITDTHSQRALTLAYAPIEQITGRGGGTGPWSDIFSLAVTAYECLTGKLPPSASERQHGEPLTPPTDLVPDVTPALNQTLLAMLAVEAADRPADARTALAMLHDTAIKPASLQTVLLDDESIRPATAHKSTFRPIIDHQGKGRIMSLATAPAGQSLAVGTSLGIWIYNSQTMAEQYFIATDGPIEVLALVDDGAALAAMWRGVTRRFTLETGSRPRQSGEYASGASCIAVAPDGRTIAATQPGGGLAIQAFGEAVSPIALAGIAETPQLLCFSPDGVYVAAAVRREVFVWKSADGALLWRTSEHQARVSACAFDPAGQILAIAAGQIVTLYRMNDGRRLRELPTHPARIGDLAFSPDGRLLSVAGALHLRLWQLPEGQVAPAPDPFPAPIISARFIDAGVAMSIASETAITRWQLSESRTGPSTEGHMGRLYSVVWAGKDTVVTGGDTIRIWKLHERRLRLAHTIDASVEQGGGLAVSPDGALLARSRADGVTLWQLSDGTASGALQSALAQSNALAFTPDNSHLVVAAETVAIWPVAGNSLKSIVSDTMADAFDLALAADGSACAALSDEGVQIWSIPDGVTLARLNSDTLVELIGSGAPLGIALAPRAQALALIADKGVFIVDLDRPDLQTHLIETSAQYAVFAPDSQTIATIDESTIALWQRQNTEWRSLHTLTGHADFVTAVAFEASGHILASVSLDGTVRIWKIEEDVA